MEADIKHAHEEPNAVTALNLGENGERNKMESKEESPFLGSALKSSTPIERVEKGFILKTFGERDDSGFSEATLSSTPLSSLGRTSCSSLASSSSLTECDISPINSQLGRRFPQRRRRRYRHSDPDLSSLAMRIQFLEDNDMLSLHSQHDIARRESEDLSVNKSQPTISSLDKPVKRNFPPEMCHTGSLSSMSDELEASFQEMSLEETSSQSSSSISSSPGVSTSLQSLPPSRYPPDNSQSDPITAKLASDDVTVISVSGKACEKPSIISSASMSKSPQQASDKSDFITSLECEGQIDFPAKLLFIPKVQTLQGSPDSSIPAESVTLDDESTICDTLSPNKHPCVMRSNSKESQRDDSSSSHQTAVESSPPRSTVACISSLSHTANFNSLLCQSRLQVSSSPPSEECIFQSPTKEESLFKSPTKRTHKAQIKNPAISPFKMRKISFDVEKPKTLANVKRNFTQTDILLPSDSSLHNIERCPQYYNIDLCEVKSKDRSNDKHISTKDITFPFVPGQDGGLDISDSRNARLSSVIQAFCPSVPSRLIGRRVGLIKCDVIGELTKQNFIGCLGCIFQYLSDVDLTSVARVSQIWKTALNTDSHSYRRFQRYQLAQCRFRQQLGKENVSNKPKDESMPSITTAKGPLNVVQQVAAEAQATPTKTEAVPLLWDDSKRTCPKCVGTALYYPAENRATCTRGNCDFVFCTLCFLAYHHPKPCKPLFSWTSKADLAGTRKSKKTLKRL